MQIIKLLYRSCQSQMQLTTACRASRSFQRQVPLQILKLLTVRRRLHILRAVRMPRLETLTGHQRQHRLSWIGIR